MKLRIFIFFIIFTFFSSMFLYPQEIGPWERVDPGSGFGSGSNRAIFAMAVYRDHLYVSASWNSYSAPGFEIWRFDGSTWIRVATGGIGDSTNICVWSMGVFNDRLYIGTVYSRVYVYDEANTIPWTQVNTDGFGDANNYSVDVMAIYNNRLYAGTYNDYSGGEIFEYDGSGWTLVHDGMLFYSSGVRCMAVYNGFLYAGFHTYYGYGEVYRYDNTPLMWTQVGNQGLDSSNWNPSIRTMTVFNGLLYAGVGSYYWGTQVFSFDGLSWTPVSDYGFNIGSYATHDLEVYAGRLFASLEGRYTTPLGVSIHEYIGGSTWNQVNVLGFGDSNNTQCHDLAVYRNKLYAGTSNSNGCQVWRASYRYPVTAVVSGGNGTVSPASQLVDLGDDGIININPAPGYRINSIVDNNAEQTICNPYCCYDVRDNHNVVVSFALAGYPPTIQLSAVRRTEQAWIVKKDYGEITISITEHPSDPMPVARYVLYRIDGGSMTQLAEFTTAGSHSYNDMFIDEGVTCSYQVKALDAAGTVVAQSEIATI